MRYDFDSVIDRRGTDSVKWDVKENELPMWVADMDFKAAPEILSFLEERLQHGVFGYSDIPEEWYSAYIRWWKERHAFDDEQTEPQKGNGGDGDDGKRMGMTDKERFAFIRDILKYSMGDMEGDDKNG